MKSKTILLVWGNNISTKSLEWKVNKRVCKRLPVFFNTPELYAQPYFVESVRLLV